MGVMFSAVVDLAAFSGTTIFYVVGDATNTSRVMSFHVPLLPGMDPPIELTAYGPLMATP
jgi:hypothetical protein